MIALLAASGFLGGMFKIIFLVVCVLLILMVVVIPSQEGGMAAAFGGMGSDSFFGTKAHQHINKFMVFLAVSFLVLAVTLNRINAGAKAKNSPIEKLQQPESPPPPPPPQR